MVFDETRIILQLAGSVFLANDAQLKQFNLKSVVASHFFLHSVLVPSLNLRSTLFEIVKFPESRLESLINLTINVV